MITRILTSTLKGIVCVLIFTMIGCGSDSPGDSPETNVEPFGNPQIGDTEFISADTSDSQTYNSSPESNGGEVRDDEDSDATMIDSGAEEATVSDDTGTVEEGDIFRLIEGNRVLNLNSYSCFQIIDFTDLNHPEISGRLKVTGNPVEMVVHENMACLLLNDYRRYYGDREDIAVDTSDYGIVMAVDFNDDNNPKLVNQARIKGSILTSRIVKNEDGACLYVAARNYESTENTIIKSFKISETGLTEKSTLTLEGEIIDVQATPTAMLVASYDWGHSWATENLSSQVTIIDINDIDGNMIQGADITLKGFVNHKSNMDLYQGVLRVVSNSNWSGENKNYLETFNVEDIRNPVAVDQEEFGDNENLEATIFLGNKAFFVTYFRTDPFHAFEIDDSGNAEEKSEYVISGWNDFFKPVFNGTRLIGIGKNDEEGVNVAISLYDISDLENPAPFIARAEVDSEYSWSEANYDDRAFSVIEDSVSVKGENGATETGMVLVPFSGYSSDDYKNFRGVQIFTFSETSLTKRGLMPSNITVRRSFMAEEDVVSNLSHAAFGLFDSSDPDTPVELGQVDLYNNYTDFYIYEGSGGEYGVRLKRNSDNADDSDIPDDELQVIPLNGSPDSTAPVAVVNIPGNSRVYKVGNLVVAVTLADSEVISENDVRKTRIVVIDMQTPASPKIIKDFLTDVGYYSGYEEIHYSVIEDEDVDIATSIADDSGDTVNLIYYYPIAQAEAIVSSKCLIFPQTVQRKKQIGMKTYCRKKPKKQIPYIGVDFDGFDINSDVITYDGWTLDSNGVFYDGEEYFTGSILCVTSEDGTTSCSGSIYRAVLKDGKIKVVEIDPDTIETEDYCYDQEEMYYWHTLNITVLDLSDPSNPAFSEELAMDENEEFVDMVEKDESLYYSYKLPVEDDDENDDKTYAKYYFKRIDLKNPSQPVVGAPVNVPGKVIHVNGNEIYTHDHTWNDSVQESTLYKLLVENDVATLNASKTFPGRNINTMLVDDTGRAFVSHSANNRYYYYEDAVMETEQDAWQKLTILDLTGENTLTALSETNIDTWATLRTLASDRTIFSISGGLLVINCEDATAPYAQAFFPGNTYSGKIRIHDSDIIIPAGGYGIYQFQLDTDNLN